MYSCSAPEIAGRPDFWERVRAAPHRLLALDYDGTLAPFRLDRDAARPLNGVVDAIRRIRETGGTTVAIVSGRPVREVAALVGSQLRIPIFGSHGYEFMSPEGLVETAAPAPDHEAGLKACWQWATDAGFSARLERKIAAVAVHTRDATDAEALLAQVHNHWASLAEAHGLNLVPFNGGLEVKATDRNKGTAVAQLLRTTPPRTLCVYIGDDTTDEDAFSYLRATGLGIKVGNPAERTAATGRVDGCEAVREILRAWCAFSQTGGQDHVESRNQPPAGRGVESTAGRDPEVR